MALIYLAGPIDAVSDEERKDWREDVARRVKEHGIATFSPLDAFECDTSMADVDTCEKLATINDYALKKSNAVIANLGGRSYGTSLECELARRRRIPVYAFGVSSFSIYRYRFAAWTPGHFGSIKPFQEEYVDLVKTMVADLTT